MGASLGTAGGRWRYGVSRCAALGLVAAGLELAAIGATTRYAPDLGWVGLVAACAAVDVALAAAIGAVAGVVALPSPRDEAVPIAQMLAATAFFGSGAFFWRGAWLLWDEGSELGSVLFVSIPVAALAFTYFLGRYAVRQRGDLVSPWPVGAGVLGVGALVGALAGTLRQPSGDPVADATNLVLVTIDGLAAGEEGPAFRAFAAEGVSFSQAVSPEPLTRPAHAAMLVGLHPLRSGVITNEDVLSRAHETAFEAFEDAGYATGAFVSDAALAAGSGLEDGFGTWDDGFRPAWQRATLLSAVLRPSGWRPAAETWAAFDAWLTPRETRPFAVWLHFADPVHVPGGREAADAAIARIRERLDAAGQLDRTVVLLAGSHGVSLGEPASGLGDGAIHVPMALRFTTRFQVPEVAAQVRLVDVANTLLDALRFPERDRSEGVALSGYGTGLRKATLSASLLGRERDGAWFVGVRNNGVKVLLHPDDRLELYDLGADPAEQHDIAAAQETTARQARGLLEVDRAALQKLLRDRRPLRR